jgi:hypothetical protein
MRWATTPPPWAPGHAIVLFGTWAEFILPALIVLGLFTRIAALGMIGFVIVQTWVDIIGHGVGHRDHRRMVQQHPGDAIVDQRAFWIFLLLVLVLRGAGPAVARCDPLAALQKRRLHRRVPAQVKPPVARFDHGPLHHRGMGGQELAGAAARAASDSPRQVVERVHQFRPEAPSGTAPAWQSSSGVSRTSTKPVMPRLAQARESPCGRYRSSATRRPSSPCLLFQ